MKLNNTLKALTVATALMAAAPSVKAEEMTGAQRSCVQRVLKSPNVDTDAVQACLSAREVGSDDLDKVKKELAPDSMEAQTLFATLEARFNKEAPYHPDVVKFAE